MHTMKNRGCTLCLLDFIDVLEMSFDDEHDLFEQWTINVLIYNHVNLIQVQEYTCVRDLYCALNYQHNNNNKIMMIKLICIVKHQHQDQENQIVAYYEHWSDIW